MSHNIVWPDWIIRVKDGAMTFVNQEEAYKSFAESINKTVEALSDQDKQLAILNATLESKEVKKWARRMRRFRFLRERVHLMWMTIGFLLASVFWFILIVGLELFNG